MLDDFNRADNTDLGANWTQEVGVLHIRSNQLEPITTGAVVRARWNPALGVAHAVEAVVVAGLAGAFCITDVFARKDAAAETFYNARIRWDSGTPLMLNRSIAGSAVSLASSSAITPIEGVPMTLRLEVNGSLIRVLVDGVERISLTNAEIDGVTVGGPHIGIQGFQTSTQIAWESFDGGPLGGVMRGIGGRGVTGPLT